MVQKEILENKEKEVLKVLLGHQDHLEKQEVLEIQDRLELSVRWEQQE